MNVYFQFFNSIIGSQVHTFSEVERGLWRSSDPNPCSVRVIFLEQAAQDHIHTNFKSQMTRLESRSPRREMPPPLWATCVIVLMKKICHSEKVLPGVLLSYVSVCVIASCKWAPLNTAWLCLCIHG